MCEILLIIAISRSIAAMMKTKGRSAGGYVALFVFLWIVGEASGFVVAMLISDLGNPNRMGANDGFDVTLLICIYGGAALGGGAGYAIAASMPALEVPERRRPRFDRFDEDEDDYERDRRRRRREEEEDERPRRPRAEDEDKFEDDERPPRPRDRDRDRDDGNFEQDRPRPRP